VKLARAVRFLQSSNILHRDIRPRNIVLSEEGADPVIIDFGFARRLTAEFKSIQDSEYSAPEVRRNNPNWTRAADIYSLAATLRAVLDTNDAKDPVLHVLNKCLADNPDNRPDAATLVSLFDKAASDLHIADRKAEVDQSVKDATIPDRSKRWYSDTVNKLHGKFAAVALGLLPDQFERCREAANLMNQVLEAYPVPTNLGINKLTLGVVKNENTFCGKKLMTEPLRLMHALRNFEAHGKNKERADLLSRFPYRTDADLKQASIRAAEQIGTELSLQSLSAAVRLLL
jgi:serine/threonine protein kinase